MTGRELVNAAGETERDRLSGRANLIEAAALFLLTQVGLWAMPRAAGDILLVGCAVYVAVAARFVHRDGPESWGLPRPFAVFSHYRSLASRGRLALIGVLVAVGVPFVLAFRALWPYLLLRAGVRRFWPDTYAWLAPSDAAAVPAGLLALFLLATMAIRWDRWRDAGRLLGWGVVLWTCIALLGLDGDPRPRGIEFFVFYVLWAMLQQYCILGYFNGRLRRGLAGRVTVALLSAGIFAWLHAPHWTLVGATFPLAFLFGWYWQADRHRNLFVFGIVHGVAGGLYSLATAAPMSVGPWSH